MTSVGSKKSPDTCLLVVPAALALLSGKTETGTTR
jgi:hypothetical protein